MPRAGSRDFVRYELDRLLKRHGPYVYAVVANRSSRCRCYNEAVHEADPSCLRCFGLGYDVTVRRLATYSRSQTPPAWGHFGATQVQQPGVVEAGGKYFYFTDDIWLRSSPSGGDLVLEPKYDTQGRVSGLLAVYVVGVSEPFYSFPGGPSYYRVACRLDSSSLRVREKALLAWLSRSD